MRIVFVSCVHVLVVLMFSISAARAGTRAVTLNVSFVIAAPKLASVLSVLDDRAKLVRRVTLMKAHMSDTGEELTWQAGNGSGHMVVTGRTSQNGAVCATVSERIVAGNTSVIHHGLACG